jgi:hypothetical protein
LNGEIEVMLPKVIVVRLIGTVGLLCGVVLAAVVLHLVESIVGRHDIGWDAHAEETFKVNDVRAKSLKYEYALVEYGDKAHPAIIEETAPPVMP